MRTSWSRKTTPTPVQRCGKSMHMSIDVDPWCWDLVERSTSMPMDQSSVTRAFRNFAGPGSFLLARIELLDLGWWDRMRMDLGAWTMSVVATAVATILAQRALSW